MLSWAAKWLGEKKVECKILPDYPLYKKNPEDDSALAKDLWKWFDEADIIIGHNLAQFDRTKSNTRFKKAGLLPPSPAKIIDTLKIAWKEFGFASNKLGDIANFLETEHRKIETDKRLQLRCMAGDMKAWRELKKYNIGDVFVSEDVYMDIRAWDSTHPNITLANPVNLQCPVCGHKTERRGYRYLKSYIAWRYHCLNKTCGKWSSGKRERIDAQILN
jgi:hypothetical protein